MTFKLLELDNAQYYYTDHVKRVTKKKRAECRRDHGAFWIDPQLLNV